MEAAAAPKLTVQLIGIGRVSAIPAGDVAEGMTVVWSYGLTSTVVAVRDVGPKTVELDLRYENPRSSMFGQVSTVRRRKAAPIVAR